MAQDARRRAAPTPAAIDTILPRASTSDGALANTGRKTMPATFQEPSHDWTPDRPMLLERGP